MNKTMELDLQELVNKHLPGIAAHAIIDSLENEQQQKNEIDHLGRRNEKLQKQCLQLQEDIEKLKLDLEKANQNIVSQQDLEEKADVLYRRELASEADRNQWRLEAEQRVSSGYLNFINALMRNTEFRENTLVSTASIYNNGQEQVYENGRSVEKTAS